MNKAKFTKEQIMSIVNNFERFMEVAESLSMVLHKVYPMRYDYVGADYLYEVSDTHITIRDACEDTLSIPIEYFYDNEALEKLQEALDNKRKQEEESQRYYRKIQEEDEKKELKRLMKKYPDIKG
ncbi:hypothetical protein PQE72_gp077 [Bacillus phage vB_BanS_Skywalker]|uniref:Uncharacterized protein n=1 Tax=Bacillus phage vB_BanS_Skywalker TaxID=2894789 RepID=A0AAE8YVM5_9CAUD|nr:hypothetical protein PQE72_gp077 [Bacillus phage vB_BanS_Skywalker]UGO51366.1 hypothetical protein SKYWALKER_209 [Bacillus phage vB_BanS_Skywalker]